MNRVKTAEKRKRRKRAEIRSENLRQQRDRQVCSHIIEDLGFREFGIEGDLIGLILANRSRLVQLRDATGGGSEPQLLLRTVRTLMKQVRWAPPSLSHSYSFEEFCTLVRPAMSLLRSYRSQLRSSAFGAADRATAWRAKLGDLERIDEEFMSWMSCELGNMLSDFCRMYESLYYFRRPSGEGQEGTNRVVWELHRVRPERVRLLVNGESRWVFRCGQSVGLLTPDKTVGVEWLSWNTEALAAC